MGLGLAQARHVQARGLIQACSGPVKNNIQNIFTNYLNHNALLTLKLHLESNSIKFCIIKR